MFRSRLNPGIEAEYADEIFAYAEKMPGFLSAKDFVADDGEQLTVIEFDTAEHLAAWRDHPEHAKAQAEGRAKFYASYQIQICKVERGASFDAATGAWNHS